MAIRHRLPLPGILLIDGISSPFGGEGLDPERVEAIYSYLKSVSDEVGSDLQIIAVDNRIPESTRQFVRLELREDDRLIPENDLAQLKQSKIVKDADPELK